MVIPSFAWYLIAVSPWIRILRHWGGIGLLALGLLGSVLPLPGGIEIATVVLAARHRDLWWYYGMMATVGSCLSGVIYYYFGWSGGPPLLAKRISARQAAVWTERLKTWGFGVVVLSGLIPPPIPTSPMLIAAGVVRYPRDRFAGALVIGRGLRFMLLALAGHIYRRRAVTMVNRMILPMVIVTLVGLALYGILMWYKLRQQRDVQEAVPAITLEPAAANESPTAGSVLSLSEGTPV